MNRLYLIVVPLAVALSLAGCSSKPDKKQASSNTANAINRNKNPDDGYMGNPIDTRGPGEVPKYSYKVVNKNVEQYLIYRYKKISGSIPRNDYVKIDEGSQSVGYYFAYVHPKLPLGEMTSWIYNRYTTTHSKKVKRLVEKRAKPVIAKLISWAKTHPNMILQGRIEAIRSKENPRVLETSGSLDGKPLGPSLLESGPGSNLLGAGERVTYIAANGYKFFHRWHVSKLEKKELLKMRGGNNGLDVKIYGSVFAAQKTSSESGNVYFLIKKVALSPTDSNKPEIVIIPANSGANNVYIPARYLDKTITGFYG